jgi:hypothetical protein
MPTAMPKRVSFSSVHGRWLLKCTTCGDFRLNFRARRRAGPLAAAGPRRRLIRKVSNLLATVPASRLPAASASVL